MNGYRLPANSHLAATFNVVLQGTQTDEVAVNCPHYHRNLLTPTDVQGPFYIDNHGENPEDFPNRIRSCVTEPVCRSDGGDDTEGCAGYSGGIEIILNGVVFGSDGDRCWKIEGARVDLWSADPAGNYWRADEHWRNRRQNTEEEEHSGLFNCRAVTHTSEEGEYHFESLMPGHYMAGGDFRPRHLHMKVAKGGQSEIVTQVYFAGDPLLGAKDTACSACKSWHEDLVVSLTLIGADGDGTAWDLTMLGADEDEGDDIGNDDNETVTNATNATNATNVTNATNPGNNTTDPENAVKPDGMDAPEDVDQAPSLKSPAAKPTFKYLNAMTVVVLLIGIYGR